MTREQRLAEGWVECWGLYNDERREWFRSDGWPSDGAMRKRENFLSLLNAKGNSYSAEAATFPCRFWRREKPKVFKAGDAVWIKGTVADGHTYSGLDVHFEAFGKQWTFYFYPSELHRCPSKP